MIWMYVSLGLLLGLLAESGLLIMVYPAIRNKFRLLGRKKGYIEVVKLYKDGRLQVTVEKPNENGRLEIAGKEVAITDQPFMDIDNLAKAYIIVEGMPSVLNPFKAHEITEDTKLLNDALIDSFEAGKSYAISQMEQEQKITSKLVFILIIVLLGVLVAAYFGYEAYQMLKSLKPLVESLKPQIVKTVK